MSETIGDVRRQELLPAMASPVTGVSKQIGEAIEEVHRVGERLLRAFKDYERARTTLAENNVEVKADFGTEINSAYAAWLQLQKPLGKV